jgi:hypothetical protein
MMKHLAVDPAAALRGFLADGACTRRGIAVHAALSSGGPI